MGISIIVAKAFGGVIGYEGDIPWRLPNDLKRFKELTTNNIVIMGRKTYESLGVKPLPNRTNIVLSNNYGYTLDNGVFVCNYLSSALLLCEHTESLKDKEIFIIGGYSVYKESLDIADKLYITDVCEYCNGDTFFPEFDLSKWNLISEKKVEEPVEHYYRVYNKI
jgi:dihydrofolate reductase